MSAFANLPDEEKEQILSELSPSERALVGSTLGARYKSPVASVVRTETGRYPALRLIAGVCRILALMCGLGFGAISIVFASSSSDLGKLGIVGLVGSIVVGAIAVVLFLVTSEGILVVLDIEENTRAARLDGRS